MCAGDLFESKLAVKNSLPFHFTACCSSYYSLGIAKYTFCMVVQRVKFGIAAQRGDLQIDYTENEEILLIVFKDFLLTVELGKFQRD